MLYEGHDIEEEEEKYENNKRFQQLEFVEQSKVGLNKQKEAKKNVELRVQQETIKKL